MTNIKQQFSDATPFLQLCNDPKEYDMAISRLEHMIWWSFVWLDAQLGHKTEMVPDEIKRRFLICEKWFRVLRRDLGYGVHHALDTLPRALAYELLGLPFDPPKADGRGWARSPADIQQMIKQKS